MERIDRLDILNSQLLQCIYNLYKTKTIDEVLEMEIHPLETHICNLQLANIKEFPDLCEKFGMMIPVAFTTSQYMDFAAGNMEHYHHIVSRSPTVVIGNDIKMYSSATELYDRLQVYSDREIVDALSYMLPFYGRLDLINKMWTVLFSTTFHLFEEVSELTRSRFVQTYTALTNENIDTITLPILAFGNIFNPIVTSVNDLNEALTYNIETKKIELIFPNDDDRVIYSKDNTLILAQLLDIMMLYEGHEECAHMLGEKIKAAYIFHPQMNGMLMQQLVPLIYHGDPHGESDTDDALALGYACRDLFYSAQYMFGWDGPGSSFINRRVAMNVIALPRAILHLEQAYERFPSSMRDLHFYTFSEDSALLIKKETFGTYLDKIVSSGYQTDISVKIIMDTAWMYLYLLHRPIQGYTPISPFWKEAF